jgi:hypothetical protein
MPDTENTNINAVPETPETVTCEEAATATDGCNLMATGEGNGGYNSKNPKTSASGRYQFVEKTALYTLTGMGKAKSESEARTIWNDCATSTTPDCKKLQNEMCGWYFKDSVRQMNHYGVPPTKFNMYLAWNQGPQGASKILLAAKNGEQVTDETVKRGMRGQPFFTGDSNNNYSGELFLKEMRAYLERQNYPGI